MARSVFDSFSVELPAGWRDITDTVDADEPPLSLAHKDGVGALQFSTAIYRSGVEPAPSPDELLELVRDFGSKQGLENPTDIVTEVGLPTLAAGSFKWDEDFLRVWYVSNGYDFAFVTYTCLIQDVGPELLLCEQIVRSIRF